MYIYFLLPGLAKLFITFSLNTNPVILYRYQMNSSTKANMISSLFSLLDRANHEWKKVIPTSRVTPSKLLV